MLTVQSPERGIFTLGLLQSLIHSYHSLSPPPPFFASFLFLFGSIKYSFASILFCFSTFCLFCFFCFMSPPFLFHFALFCLFCFSSSRFVALLFAVLLRSETKRAKLALCFVSKQNKFCFSFASFRFEAKLPAHST